MTVFCQNLKNYIVLSKILEYFKICENHAQECKAFHPVKYIVQAFHPVKYCLCDIAACNGVCDWLVGCLAGQ